ncbi:uncharacterized protein LOC118428407 [Branchiostoma floridae]|uniref:Uncharacterized protein LOC118428407 n=1 Tax=Branchiostoma floridae TaxID=7739 RepID=A0A9J7M4A5_BRAFL|nr:uncharacterized protein LOC118428407 [Branchiostoma floridae]
MLTLVAIACLLVATIAAPVDDPNQSHCCTPKQWSGTMRSISDTLSGGKLTTTNQTLMYYYDYNNMRAATVGKGFRLVQDFNKMESYTIVSGTCTPSKMTEPLLNCVPEKAAFIGSLQYGGPQGLRVNEYSVDAFAPNIKGRISYTADDCIPVLETVIGTGPDPSLHSIEFVDIVPSIKDPSVFDVPRPPCPTDTELDNVVDMPTQQGSPFAALP